MSGRITWRPKSGGKQVGDGTLRQLCEERYGSGATLDDSSIDYLRGLADGGVKGASELVEAIQKHGEIEINVVY